MSREIKFRAWDTETKEMSYDFLSKNWLRVCIESPYIELMQYTGLNYKDDNQEVYEDDLCENENVLYRVIWQNGQFALKVIKTLNVLARGLAFPIVHYLEGENLICKKVGTAWENPELLKGEENA